MCAAFIGGLTAILLLALVSRWQQRGGEITLLLTGVMLNFFMGGLLMLAIFLSRKSSSPPEILYLAMGSLSGMWSWEPKVLVTILTIGLGLFAWQHRSIDALQMGDNFTAAIGISPQRARLLNLSIASLLVAAAVACVGMIGFVGLLVPHFCRLLLPAGCRWQLPACLLTGATFLVVADTLARQLTMLQLELPVGVVAALLGAPMFLYLLGRSLREVRR
jgi:iron complex transport system permease protein